MSRLKIGDGIDCGVEPTEARAACAVMELADQVQYLCFALGAEGIAPSTVKVLYRAYRKLKPLTEFYFGEDSSLHWSAPDFRFQKAKGEKRC
jgi:hypothetical protein